MSRKRLAGRLKRLEHRHDPTVPKGPGILPTAVFLKGPKAVNKWVRENPDPVMLPERSDDPAVDEKLIRQIMRGRS